LSRRYAAGTALVYSTYLGGSDNDVALAIAFGFQGSAYVTGTYYFNKLSDANAFQSGYAGNGDALLPGFNPTGSHSLFRLTWAASITMQAMTLQSTLLPCLCRRRNVAR